jgi:ubiquitin-conjugating enzyme E2 S
LDSEFPRVAPKGYFLTKIFHPNVAANGDICVNTLKKDWDPAKWSLGHILGVIRCLLIIPFPESSLNEEAGRLFMDDYQEYFRMAKLMTKIHAQPAKKTESTFGNDKDMNSEAQNEEEMKNNKNEAVFEFSSKASLDVSMEDGNSQNHAFVPSVESKTSSL